MENKYSPGPWHWKTERTMMNLKAADGEGLCVQAPTASNNKFCKPQNHVANLALLESAPRLLEVLKSLRKDIIENLGGDYFDGEWPEVNEVIKEAEGL